MSVVQGPWIPGVEGRNGKFPGPSLLPDLEEIQERHDTRNKELEEATERWRRERGSGTAEVRAEHVAQVVSKLTGIPVTELTTEERQRLVLVEEGLGGLGEQSARDDACRYRRHLQALVAARAGVLDAVVL